MRQLFLLILFIFSALLPVYSYQTIRVVAIRVEFQSDDNTLTTGNGTFRMDSTLGIDPAPHNRTYFADQIIAADNYYNAVSEGKIRIVGDVFPRGLNASYVLNHEMKYYNPNTTQAKIDSGLANLFVDAVQLANQDPGWDFADYDLVVIFHAGVGRDFDLGFDETPQDISSLFITPQYLQKNWNNTAQGIEVDNNTSLLDRGIILPETENQQDIQIALTGMCVSNIGSYLDLYDLFSADKQRAGIGQFGLMDAGLANFNGLIPAPPSAFHRKLLNWDVPLILNAPVNNQRITNRYTNSISPDPNLIEIPINEDEYYLLEYRGVEKPNPDSLIFEMSDARDSLVTYLDLLKEYFPERIHISDSSGVLLSVDNYDFGLPGKGILIWHIDESVIRNKAGHLINDNPEWRAVDVEEADGSQDIGEQYNILQSGSELGWLFDFWHANNDAPLYKNEFSSSTIPNTSSNLNHAETGIVIKNFSSYKNDYMTFDYSRDYFENGFPVCLKSSGSKTFTIRAVPTGKENEFIFTMNDSGYVYAVGAQGKGLLYDQKVLLAKVVHNNSGVFSMALADTNFIPDGKGDILLVMSDGSLYNFDLCHSDIDSLAGLNYVESGISQAISSPIVLSGNQLFVVDGLLIRSYLATDSVSQTPQNISSQYLNDLLLENSTPYSPPFDIDYIARINDTQVVTATQSDQGTDFNILANGESESTFFTESIVDQFGVGDIDGNGSVDIVYNSNDKLFAKNLNGSSVINFPVSPFLADDEFLIGTPLIVDISGNGEINIIITTNKGQIMAYDKNGKVVSGFPLSAGGVFSSSGVVLRLDNDSALELAVVSGAGSLSVWEIPGSNSSSKIIWGSTNLNNANNAVFKESYVVQQVGTNLIPKSRFFNYPNPNDGDFTNIRYYLNEGADVTIRIFDTAGYKVDQFKGPGAANTTNEIVWDVGNISSGVYVCQLEAVSKNHTERKLIKIMVVH